MQLVSHKDVQEALTVSVSSFLFYTFTVFLNHGQYLLIIIQKQVENSVYLSVFYILSMLMSV